MLYGAPPPSSPSSPFDFSQTHKIPLRMLRNHSSRGLLTVSSPSSSSHSVLSYNTEQSLRPIVWSVLLEYLPPRLSDWSEAVSVSRSAYWSFVRELLTDNKDIEYSEEALLSATGVLVSDRQKFYDGLDSDVDSSRKPESKGPDSPDTFLLHEILKVGCTNVGQASGGQA